MIQKIYEKWKEGYQNIRLNVIIWVLFSLTAVVASIFMGLSFYTRFSAQLQYEVQQQNQSLLNQVNTEVGTYLQTMMKMSDTLAYSVIKNGNVGDNNWEDSFQLLYEVNKDKVKNIVLFTEEGEPQVMAPAAAMKESVNPTEEDWFQVALSETENLHFSTPHVQNLFVDSEYQNEWVISLSRTVQITDGNKVTQGVLLIDLYYSGLKQLFNSVSLGQDGYLYMVNDEGEMIYHPNHQLLLSGIETEEVEQVVQYREGSYEEDERNVEIKKVGYTGWIIAGVTEKDAITLNSLKNNIFFLFLVLFFTSVLTLINSFISEQVTKPINHLEARVKEVKNGNLDTEIVPEGFYEVRHLGYSVKNMKEQIKKLMQDIVFEHESKRKSELDILQSQINPHFLYNTLDIIVWMIENERQQDASQVVIALAKFFRISLSKGKNIISVQDEIEHVSNYLMIQKMRFKNRFTYRIEVDEEVKDLRTIKLILQPLVENAIYHGMEYMDGDGEIYIHAYLEGDLNIRIQDNGLGMDEEMVQKLVQGEVVPTEKGSGIGVRNVNERIKLYFGENYGLFIESELDEGTTITIRLPGTVLGEV